MRSLIAGGLALALIFFAAPAAFADDTTIPVSGMYELIRPYLIDTIGATVGALLVWVAALIKTKTGLDIEARHREALQTAILNGAGLVVAKVGVSLQGKTIDVKHAAIRDAVLYVQDAVPDALKRFGLGPDDVARRIEAAIGKLTATSSPAPA